MMTEVHGRGPRGLICNADNIVHLTDFEGHYWPAGITRGNS